MNRTKLLKLSIPLLLAIVFLSCANTVNAWGHRAKVTYRPFNEWTDTNPSIFYGWSNPSYCIWLADWFYENTPPPPSTYGGCIKERQLPDGSAEVTVCLTLHNAPIYGLWDLNNFDPFDGNGNEYSMFEEGNTIGFYLEINKFIIPYPGAPIPNIFEITYPDDWISTFGCGWGSGIFTEYAEGFPQGEQGSFFVYQYAYMNEEGEFIWTHEVIEVYEQ